MVVVVVVVKKKKMSECILKSLPHLIVLCKASPKLIRLMLAEEGNEDLINALIEIFINVIETKILICPTSRKILKNCKVIELLADYGGGKRRKRKKLNFELKKKQFIRYGPKIIPLVLPSVLKQIYSDESSKKIVSDKSN